MTCGRRSRIPTSDEFGETITGAVGEAAPSPMRAPRRIASVALKLLLPSAGADLPSPPRRGASLCAAWRVPARGDWGRRVPGSRQAALSGSAGLLCAALAVPRVADSTWWKDNAWWFCPFSFFFSCVSENALKKGDGVTCWLHPFPATRVRCGGRLYPAAAGRPSSRPRACGSGRASYTGGMTLPAPAGRGGCRSRIYQSCPSVP